MYNLVENSAFRCASVIMIWLQIIEIPTQTGLSNKVKSFSCVQLFVTPWTVAYQAPPCMEFSRQEYQSGLPFPSPRDLPNLGIKPGLLHCRQSLYHLSHQGSPNNISNGKKLNILHLRSSCNQCK